MLTFASQTPVSQEMQFCLELMAAKGVKPCTSSSYEDDQIINVFSRSTRATKQMGRSPRLNVRFIKSTGELSVIGQ